LRRDPWVVPALWLFGGTASRAYLVVGPDTLTVRFGWFQHHFSRRQLTAVHRVRRPWGGGFGWHTNFRGWIALTGSMAGVLELTFAPAERVRWFGLSLPCARRLVSLEQPDAFLQALGFPP
jgi:hypothetical protein